MGTRTFICVSSWPCCGTAINRRFPRVSCDVYILQSHPNLQRHKIFCVISKCSEIMGCLEQGNYTTIKQLTKKVRDKK
jgi:hypothetical protein